MPLPANIIIHRADDDSSDDVGFDLLGCEDEVGFDAMSLLSGAGGMLSGFGGMFGGDSGKGGKTDAQTQLLMQQKQQAEQSAQNMKMILAVGAAILGAGVIVMVAKK